MTLPLSELTAFIRRVFALNLPEAVWVSAELGQVNESRGHYWLTLVEKSEENETIVAQLEGVIWAGRMRTLRKEHGAKLMRGLLTEGMSVRLRITTSFHERYGLRLMVEDIDPEFTIGSLERRRQATMEALDRDGLLGRNAALPFPSLPQRLAVVSSDTAAGLEDFEQQLRTNAFSYAFSTELFPAAMQGALTTEEIGGRLRQIRRRRTEFDAIAIVRGGGGRTDLAAFDDEQLCRAVANAPLPVLAGIGHEIDDTVLDRVVHRSVKTPTAAATFLIDNLVRAESYLLGRGRSAMHLAERALQNERLRLDRSARSVGQHVSASLKAEHQRAAAHEQLLNALRPETTLARGFALVSQSGRLISDPAKLQTGEVEVRLAQGRTRLRKD